MIPCIKARSPGFTLIELLVVIAIIALLVSILMPSLTSAREAARVAICGTNQKNIALANAMYADDHNGIYIRNHNDNFGQWYNRLRPYVGYQTREQNYAPPDGTCNQFICPSDATGGGELALGASPYGFASTANQLWIARSYNVNRTIQSRRITEIVSTGSVMSTADHDWWLGNTRTVSPVPQSVILIPIERHRNGQVQVGYLDTHAAPAKVSDIIAEAERFMTDYELDVPYWGAYPGFMP